MAAPGQMSTAPGAFELLDLPDELLVQVFEHLMATRDLGRAGCVCRAWRAGDSPVERVLRQRIEARGDAVSAALPPVAAVPITHRLCLLDSIGAAQAVSGVISPSYTASAAVDAHSHLCVWGRLRPSDDNYDDDGGDAGVPIFSYGIPITWIAVDTARIERVSAGGGHILALTDVGEVLSFGWGGDGQLGHGDEGIQLVPKMIEGLRGVRIVMIAAGQFHNMVLTDEGTVLSFGMGRCGRLGHGDREHQLVPKVIEALRDTRVVAIAAGSFHSMVLTDEGTVLSFGDGGYGKLGHGNKEEQHVPKVVEALRGVRVVAIAAGDEHSMVLTDEGVMLSFGQGWDGQLGHGNKEEQLEPKVIAGATSTSQSHAFHQLEGFGRARRRQASRGALRRGRDFLARLLLKVWRGWPRLRPQSTRGSALNGN